MLGALPGAFRGNFDLTVLRVCPNTRGEQKSKCVVFPRNAYLSDEVARVR